ncbi:MAG: hypothetical protein BWZ08_02643 [candidate division BRC1 bacterium ADurb.BinA292]|nr:MAG: hypothetical protein BWZ08_02643 [candidate division BRC1 bacterium ADurb.BinA292]
MRLRRRIAIERIGIRSIRHPITVGVARQRIGDEPVRAGEGFLTVGQPVAVAVHAIGRGSQIELTLIGETVIVQIQLRVILAQDQPVRLLIVVRKPVDVRIDHHRIKFKDDEFVDGIEPGRLGAAFEHAQLHGDPLDPGQIACVLRLPGQFDLVGPAGLVVVAREHAARRQGQRVARQHQRMRRDGDFGAQ